MKNFKKAMALVMACVLCLFVFGCSASNEDSTTKGSAPAATDNSGTGSGTSGTENSTSGTSSQVEQPGEISYPVQNGVTLSYGMTTSSNWNDRYDKWSDLPLGQAIQEQTGYTLEMVHVENNTAMNLLIAGGDLPDMIFMNFAGNYAGGQVKALKDGIVFGLEPEFLQQYAPDYWAVLSSNDAYMKQATTPLGPIFGFQFIVGDDLLKGGYGMIIRDDWCEQLNIAIPQTAVQFYDMLVAFKEQLGVEYPMSIRTNEVGSLMERGIVTSAFGQVMSGTYVKDGQVRIGYAEPEYKDVLTWFHQLYEEGLLDVNFLTLDEDTMKANILTGRSGVSAGAAGSYLGTLLSASADQEDFSLMGIKNLVAKEGDTPMYGHYNNDLTGHGTVITEDCEHKEDAAKFLNYGYTQAGHVLYNFGIEGESFTMVNGEPTFTDKVLNNPDGLTVSQALSEYISATGNGPFVQDKNYLLQYYSRQEQKDALVNWCDNDARLYKLPNITIPDDVNDEYSSLKTEIETYMGESRTNFITGTRSLDEFDAYIDQLEAMGLQRLIDIQMEALAEYNSR